MSSRPVTLTLASLIPVLMSCADDRADGPLGPPPLPNAIVFGTPDVANTYSNVGAFIIRAPDGDVFPICSGTLIAATAFLTAAHCTAFFEAVLAPEGYTAALPFTGSALALG